MPPLFHKGHTNKIAATIGRMNLNFYQTTVIAVAMIQMLKDDNPNFDQDAFLRCITDHKERI